MAEQTQMGGTIHGGPSLIPGFLTFPLGPAFSGLGTILSQLLLQGGKVAATAPDQTSSQPVVWGKSTVVSLPECSFESLLLSSSAPTPTPTQSLWSEE